MLDSIKIGRFMKDLMSEYDKFRGRCPREVGASFWDVVVISAGDEEQRAWYEAQLSLKHEAGELPLVTFLCIPDPPGPRQGELEGGRNCFCHWKNIEPLLYLAMIFLNLNLRFWF